MSEKPPPEQKTWSQLHPEREKEREAARESMRRLRARYERATGKTAKGHEFHAWVLADQAEPLPPHRRPS